jgi:hypothetical protein
MTFPFMAYSEMGMEGTFYVFSAYCFCIATFSLLVLRETKGKLDDETKSLYA